VVVADEPTAHLDAGSAEVILTLLQRLNREFAKTLVVATRDPQVTKRADTRYQLDRGLLGREGALVPLRMGAQSRFGLVPQG
jgi:putative ABC transport system ATP-binding protein